MGIEEGTQTLGTIILDTMPFGTVTIMLAIAVLLSLLIVTRDTNKWARIALPITIGWFMAGIQSAGGIIIIIATGIIYIIDGLSMEGIGTILDVKTEDLPVIGRIKERRKIKRARKSQETKEKIKAYRYMPATTILPKHAISKELEARAMFGARASKKKKAKDLKKLIREKEKRDRRYFSPKSVAKRRIKADEQYKKLRESKLTELNKKEEERKKLRQKKE